VIFRPKDGKITLNEVKGLSLVSETRFFAEFILGVKIEISRFARMTGRAAQNDKLVIFCLYF
jgi:hypothetical protein